MRKRIFGKRLKRDINERKALFKSLMNSFVLEVKIKTTEAKAKAIRGEVEKMVTAAKNKDEGARRTLIKAFGNDKVVDKIIKDIAPKFKSRRGGYTRILRVGRRIKDAAPMVLMTWTELVLKTSFEEPKRKSLRPQKTLKKSTEGTGKNSGKSVVARKRSK